MKARDLLGFLMMIGGFGTAGSGGYLGYLMMGVGLAGALILLYSAKKEEREEKIRARKRI